MKFPRLLQAKALPDFQLWVQFQDNAEAVIDFRKQIALPVMLSNATPEAFARVRVAETGSYCYWDVDVPPTERLDASSDWLYLEMVPAEAREKFEEYLTRGENWQNVVKELLCPVHRIIIAACLGLMMCIGTKTLYAQTKTLDSLNNALKTAKEDTNKLRLLCNIVEQLSSDNLSLSTNYSLQAKSLAEKFGNQSLLASTLYQLGNIYYRRGAYVSAVELCAQALAISQTIGDKALEAKALNRMGTVYRRQREYKKAILFLDSAKNIHTRLGDKRGISAGFINLGDVTKNLHQDSLALKYYSSALEIDRQLKDTADIAYSLANVGGMLRRLKNYSLAEKVLKESLTLAEKIQSKSSIHNALDELSLLAEGQKKYHEAIKYSTRDFLMCQQRGSRSHMAQAAEGLATCYAALKQFDSAYKYQVIIRGINDSLFTNDISRKIYEAEFKGDLEKKKTEIELLKTTQEKQTLFRNALLGGLLLVSTLVVVLLYSNNQRKKANKRRIMANVLLQEQAAEIQRTNTELQQKNIEITASRERLEVMSEVGRSLTASLAVETIITNLYNRVAEVMDATVFGIGIIRTEKGVIEYRLALDKGERFPSYDRDLGDANQFPVWSIREQKPVFINDVDVEGEKYIPAFIESIKVHAKNVEDYPKSLLYVPLLLEGASIGVLSVQSYKRHAYSQADLETLQTLANYAAIAIANAESTEEIIRQKAIVEEFNRNIQDSIRYAKRIQDAMLPSTETLNRLLPEHFIFFRPKDVVSGDFYWCKEVQGKVFAAAVDCTGHGVPGAFMSLIGNALLNDITQRLPEPHPDVILNELHRELQTVLRQKETNNDDGMDMCLCMIDKQTRIIEFAGAMNPLYAVVQGELREFKGTPEELGGREERNPVYARHVLDVSAVPKGATMLYLTTDGYKDQYNDAHQRFMPKRLRPLLQSIAAKPLEEQPKLLGEAIDAHRGEMFQVDDMLVLGVRL